MYIDRPMGYLSERYFEWLCEIVQINYGAQGYHTLAAILHGMDFYWLLDHDENRATDGLELREIFLEELSEKEGLSDGTSVDDIFPDDRVCTVLEMMVALAQRMENTVLYDSDIPDRTPDWFDHMLINLGLDDFTDDWITLDSSDEIITRVQRALDRQYDFDGNGGFWPLKHARRDQRDVEIWYQMHNWIGENVRY